MKSLSLHLFIVFLLFLLTPLARAAEWKTFQDCRYLPNATNDGDSFHVRASGKEYIFRLYFVDTPETDTSIAARVAEQAKYFHVTTAETLLIGHEAERFTRQKLSHPFTVRTCLQDARGRSRLPRYFAFVQTDSADLGESLVANGLARVYGAASDPPEMDKAEVEWSKLQEYERKAKQQSIGGWGIGSGRLNTRAREQPGPSTDSFATFFHPKNATAKAATGAPGVKLDVNHASMEALQNIPGVGNVLAGRIIDARPYKSADDLRHVKGIGAKKYEKLRPYFE
ncbi:MAG: helix-hairpin-helix domain-containing protein [Chthoniobacterales bacterium]